MGMEFDIGKCTMIRVKTWKRQIIVGRKLVNPERIRTLEGKENFQIFGPTGRGHLQTSEDERKKIEKRMSDGKKNFWKQSLPLKSHQR